jgi:hypothetical protein
MQKLDMNQGIFEKERIEGEKRKKRRGAYDYDIIWDEAEENSEKQEKELL